MGARAREEAGDLPVDEVRDDGFVLCVSPDRVALAGANDRGTLYAAYELIERLGVRWYGPNPEDEYVPRRGGPGASRGDGGDQPVVPVPVPPVPLLGDGRAGSIGNVATLFVSPAGAVAGLGRKEPAECGSMAL